MKKVIRFLLTLALVFGLIPTSLGEPIEVLAIENPTGPTEGICGDNLTWELTEDTGVTWALAQGKPYKLTIKGSGPMNDFGDYMSAPWYNYRAMITSVSFPEGMTTIKEGAFRECVSLKSVTIPNSVITIEESAFRDCNLLETVTLGSELETIEGGAFCYCYELKSIVIPDKVTSIGTAAFLEDSHIETVICGKSLKTIGVNAFSKNQSLTTIQLNEGLETINDYAFSECQRLRTISFPASITTIGKEVIARSRLETIQVAEENSHFCVLDGTLYEKKENGTPYRAIGYALLSPADTIHIAEGTEVIDSKAFCQASNLTSVTFPDTLKTIKSMAFNSCKNLKELYISDSVETIENYVFSNCALEELHIPDGVKIIWNNTFADNASLKSVFIGKGLQILAGSIFEGCKALTNITIAEENPYLDTIDNVVYNKEHTILYFYPTTKSDIEYHLPNNLENIMGHSIFEVPSLEELYIPETLTEISYRGIYGNKKLKSIYFMGKAPTLENVTYSIFSNADNLILYHIPSSEGWDAAEWSKYTLAEWEPENLTQQEGELDGVSWKYEGDKGRILFTGSGKLRDFSEEDPAPWSPYMDAIQTVEATGITEIGANAFCNAEKLIRLEMDADLKNVGDSAFANCGNLKFLEIAKIENIGKNAFQNNGSIENSLILEKVASIGARAFQGCSSITEVTLGSHLESLEAEVFADCPALVYFIVPESVTSIKNGAFRGCASLRTINIPANVNMIETQAFSGDTSLEKVYFYGKVPENWSPDSFSNCKNGLKLCYRKAQTDWEKMGETWNGISLLGLERFYTEKQDHYSFENRASSFGYPSKYKVPRQRYVDVLDSIVSGTYYYAINDGWNGSCYGMASTTLEFYENPESFPIADYDASAKNLYTISAPCNKDAALTKLIEAYQISQYKPVISGYSGSIRTNMKDYKGLVQKVEEFERSGGLRADAQAEPIGILLYANYGGHMVIPVSVDQKENGDFLLKVYDPNMPSSLQNLIVKKDFSGISYDIYSYASYVPYSAIAASMSGIELHNNVADSSVYLSIDKAQGTVVNTEGKTIDEIEGAYEQKPLNGEDTFTGVRSFVLPEGNYQIMAKQPESTEDHKDSEDIQKAQGIKVNENTEKTEGTEEETENVTFYLASADNFAEISSSDKDAVLEVQKAETENGEIKIELQSESTKEENTSFTVMNQQGMERTVEVTGANAAVTITEDTAITVQVPEEETVSIDGKEVEIVDGQATSSFEAVPEENPWKINDFETDVVCNEEIKLNGTVTATVISNAANTKNVTITADYFDKNNKKVASYSKETQLHSGMNLISFDFEGLQTKLEQTQGEVSLSSTLTIVDESNYSVVASTQGITISLKKPSTPIEPEKPVNPDPEEPEKPVNPNPEKPEKPINPAPTNPTNIAVKSVKAKPDNITLGLGESAQLSVSVSPKNATDKSLSFTTSNNKISVTKKGKITAKKTGSSQVTIKSSNGKQAIVKITVKKAPKKITLNAKKKTLIVGKSFQIKVKLPKGTASNKITYSSNKKSVAEVLPSGKVKAKKKGTATITVKTFQGVTARLKITVNNPVAVKKVTVAKKKLTLGVGESFDLKASVSPKNATNKKLSFYTSNKRVKVSSKGKITAKKIGTTKITIKASNGKQTVVTVNVKKAPKKITLNAKKKSLRVGEKFQIKVKLPKNTASNKITYSSNKESVAKVSSSGKVTGKKKGTATITVKTFNKKLKKLKIIVK